MAWMSTSSEPILLRRLLLQSEVIGAKTSKDSLHLLRGLWAVTAPHPKRWHAGGSDSGCTISSVRWLHHLFGCGVTW